MPTRRHALAVATFARTALTCAAQAQAQDAGLKDKQVQKDLR